MSSFKIYFDEDAMDTDLVAALRSRDVEVVTVLEVGLTGKSDEEQLAFAAGRGCVLYTFNVSDFYRLHAQWISSGREHCGMILVPQKPQSVSNCAGYCIFALGQPRWVCGIGSSFLATGANRWRRHQMRRKRNRRGGRPSRDYPSLGRSALLECWLTFHGALIPSTP